MNEMQRKVQQFHETYGQTVNEFPCIPHPNDAELRISLMTEELLGEGELAESIRKQDLIGIADGLADLLYVVFGTAVTYGIEIESIFNEVHSSNMSKLGADGKPIYRDDGKVLKGPNFFLPNIGGELQKQQREGHEDKIVYRSTHIPIKFDGKVVGQGDVWMDHNGDMTMTGSIDDLELLPMIDNISVNGEDLIGELFRTNDD